MPTYKYRLRLYWNSPTSTYTESWHSDRTDAECAAVRAIRTCPDFVTGWMIAPA